jgi:hypothetical protein
MDRFNFWQKWLFYSSVIFALSGILFSMNGKNPFFELYNRPISFIFWKQGITPPEVRQYIAYTWGSVGSTMACCYILLAWIAYYPFERKEKWARNAIIMAFGTWYIIDSAVSVYYGVYFQFYIVNTFSLLVKALPVFFTWKDFEQENEEN